MGGKPNLMRWKCEKDGCFNEKKRLKLGSLAQALPGSCQFSDVDAICEYRGRFLLIEWKSREGALPLGQQILFQQLTRQSEKTIVFVVAGDAEDMSVDAICFVYQGDVSEWQQCSLDVLLGFIKDWYEQP